MNGFEPAFKLLRGFNFAGPTSCENALWLAHWLSVAAVNHLNGKVFRPPLVCIVGPPGSGKSYFVRQACQLSGLSGFTGAFAGLNHSMLCKVAKTRHPVVFMDDFRLKKSDCDILCSWITGQFWSCRKKRGSNEMETLPLAAVTIVAAVQLELPEDLARRAIIIRLEGRGS